MLGGESGRGHAWGGHACAHARFPTHLPVVLLFYSKSSTPVFLVEEGEEVHIEMLVFSAMPLTATIAFATRKSLSKVERLACTRYRNSESRVRRDHPFQMDKDEHEDESDHKHEHIHWH